MRQPRRKSEKTMRILTLSHDEIHRGSLILVNQSHALDEGAAEDLIPVTRSEPSVLLQRPAAQALAGLMDAIEGWQHIAFVSAWRSRREQQEIWDDSLRENGPEFTRTYVALPGHSEHQTGLAIDLGAKQEQIDFIRPEFPCTGPCRDFRERAAEFGFILRYPQGKEDVTGIGHEPWHFRYVGTPHAIIIQKQDMTLEEYTDYLKRFPRGKCLRCVTEDGREACLSYIEACADRMRLKLAEDGPYTLSGNNVDGFILTEWR